MNKSVYFSIAFVAFILGLMVAFQFRITNATEIPYGREQELLMERRQLESDMAQLHEEVGALSAKIEEVDKGNLDPTDAYYSELLRMRLYAGLTGVAGPGVVVTLDNPAEDLRTAVTDEDLLRIINDLRGAGAEAIAVNEQRIIATSEIRRVGKIVNVNITKVTAPYVVTAIGDAAALKVSLEVKQGLVDSLRASGIMVTVEDKDYVEIPAFTGTLQIEYAKPTQSG